MSHAEIRALCHTEAMKWVDVQRTQFHRLGVLGDWDHPYLTLDPRYEAGILDVLADLLEGGYVVRQLKPIHWCMTDRTALAEAELEYHEASTPSIYVNFPWSRACRRPGAMPARGSLMIWTTTPWTLPANVAIAVHPDLEYAGVRYVDPATGRDRPDDPRRRAGRRRSWALRRSRVHRGRPLPRPGPRSTRSIATRSSTGSARSCWRSTSASRTAPGWSTPPPATAPRTTRPAGPISFSILSPVDESGRFTAEAPDWLTGQQVFAANPAIVARLKESGHLFHEQPLVAQLSRTAGGARSR